MAKANLLQLKAIRKRHKDGPNKGKSYTEFYKRDEPGKPFATWPCSIQQPRYGSPKITLNCWVWDVTWERG